MRDGFDRLDGKAELAFLRTKEAEGLSVIETLRSGYNRETHLLIMMLNLLIPFRSRGSASFLGEPR